MVEGLVRVRFSNVQFAGSFDLSSFSYIAFGEYVNDTELLQAMFDLLFSVVVNVHYVWKKNGYIILTAT